MLMVLSKLRQVPDNQEVWIDQDGFTSIIFDITERVGSSGSGPEVDGRAMTTHLEDMVGSDINTVKIWNTAETEFSRLEYGSPSSRTNFKSHGLLTFLPERELPRTPSSRHRPPTSTSPATPPRRPTLPPSS